MDEGAVTYQRQDILEQGVAIDESAIQIDDQGHIFFCATHSR